MWPFSPDAVVTSCDWMSRQRREYLFRSIYSSKNGKLKTASWKLKTASWLGDPSDFDYVQIHIFLMATLPYIRKKCHVN